MKAYLDSSVLLRVVLGDAKRLAELSERRSAAAKSLFR